LPLLLCMIWPPPPSTLFPYTTLFRSLRLFRVRRLNGAHRIQAGLPTIELAKRRGPGKRSGRSGLDQEISRRLHEKRRQLHALRRSEEHTSELQSPDHLVCRLLLEKKK